MLFYTYQSESSVFTSIPIETIDVSETQTAGETFKNERLSSLHETSKPTGGERLLDENSLEQSLFSNREELKMLVSKVAMHLFDTARKDIFKQIDELLDIESFGEDDSLVTPSSFFTFIKFCAVTPKLKRVALTVSSSGIVGGTWIAENGKLHVDFLQNGQFRTTITQREDNEVNYLAYMGKLRGLRTFLERNQITSWYKNG